MLVPAVAFTQVVLALHIVAVVLAFGVTFAYPLFLAAGARMDPRAMPWFHRTQGLIGQRLISPGLLVVIVAGIYLASKEHQWHAFYVQWGLAIAVVIGALGGAFFSPSERKLSTLAERDIAAAGDGEVAWSEEYKEVLSRVRVVGALTDVLIVVTIYLMTVHAG